MELEQAVLRLRLMMLLNWSRRRRRRRYLTDVLAMSRDVMRGPYGRRTGRSARTPSAALTGAQRIRIGRRRVGGGAGTDVQQIGHRFVPNVE